MSLTGKLQYLMWEKTASLPSAILGAHQKMQIHKLIDYTQKNVPYYSRAWGDNKKKWEDIPVLKRSDLQKHWKSMVVPGLPPWMYRNKGGTSGSTGQPVEFYCSTFGQRVYEDEQLYVHNKLWRFLVKRGYSMKEILNEIPMVELRAIRASDHPKHLYLRAEEALSNPVEMVEKVKKHKPIVFGCYGSFNLAFCKAVVETGQVGKLKIPYVVNTGEILMPEQRKFIENTLDSQVIDRYGMEEFYWSIACENTPGGGLVNYAESYVIEIVDEHGLQVKPGETGTVVITDLTNYTMPFIRYDTGDSAELISVNGPFTTFKLIGRNIKLEFVSGTLYYYLINNIFSRHAYAITQYQFIKKSHRQLSLDIVVTNQYHQEIVDSIMVRLRELLGSGVDIQINVVPYIKRTSSGKTRVFLDQSTSKN